jgi:hypothetical protein
MPTADPIVPIHALHTIPEFSPATSAIWLLCHYPDTAETTERVAGAVALYRRWNRPIWLYGSNSARYPDSVEKMIKAELVSAGVPSHAVQCSGDLSHVSRSLDTVQEALNVAASAQAAGIETLLCLSNRLQLLQARALLKRHPLRFVWIATPLRDRRWWYLLVRLLLIPLAHAGIGRSFPPLVFVRWARAKLALWPY